MELDPARQREPGRSVDTVPPVRNNRAMPETASLGADFARAVAATDADRLRALLASDVEFRALTPRRSWEANDPDAVLEIVFGSWFDDGDVIEAVEAIDTDDFADRQRVGYRFSVRNPEGRFLIEQQAYLSERDGEIAWMRVVCSGFRPHAARQ